MHNKHPTRQFLPLWIRKLHLVKTELKGIRWPGGEEGFRQGIVLMSMGLEALEKENTQNTISLKLAKFSESDMRWIARWRKERAKIFRGTNKPRS